MNIVSKIIGILSVVALLYLGIKVIWHGCVFEVGDGSVRFELYPLKRLFNRNE